MKYFFLFIFAIVLTACSAVKQTEQALGSGNYNQAINTAVKNLQTNKNKKSKQPYIAMLEEAYKKASERDLSTISFLKKDGNPANLEKIYTLYEGIEERQEKIKPLLPLYLIKEGRNAQFVFNDYSDQIISTKTKLSAYLYDNALSLLKSHSKFDARKAFEDLQYINRINPNYKNTHQLMDEAHRKGVDFVIISLKNETDKVIPKRLEEDLLNFSTYGLNDLWTVYHNNIHRDIQYDFALQLNFREINISPEQIREKEIVKEKQIADGWEYLTDQQGNVVKDSLGNSIKVDKYRTVICSLYEFIQFKSAQVTGKVSYLDYNNNQLIDDFPIASEFIFEHRYATYKGDKRALEQSYMDLINLRAIPFPSNEQMIYDAGQDIKLRIKDILVKHKFRN